MSKVDKIVDKVWQELVEILDGDEYLLSLAVDGLVHRNIGYHLTLSKHRKQDDDSRSGSVAKS